MTLEEMSKIMNILYVSYPATFRDWKEGQFTTAKNLWFEIFKMIPYSIVMKAVKQEISENRTNFAPSVGQIMFRVKELISVYDADTAWSEVCYIVRTVDFEGIPAAVKGLDDISRQIITSRDIQRMKESAGALDKERPRFFAMYSKLKDTKEAEAVESGDLISISSNDRLLSLGVKQSELQIEMKQESEG
jgi:hypothetical protein